MSRLENEQRCGNCDSPVLKSIEPFQRCGVCKALLYEKVQLSWHDWLHDAAILALLIFVFIRCDVAQIANAQPKDEHQERMRKVTIVAEAAVKIARLVNEHEAKRRYRKQLQHEQELARIKEERERAERRLQITLMRAR